MSWEYVIKKTFAESGYFTIKREIGDEIGLKDKPNKHKIELTVKYLGKDYKATVQSKLANNQKYYRFDCKELGIKFDVGDKITIDIERGKNKSPYLIFTKKEDSKETQSSPITKVQPQKEQKRNTKEILLEESNLEQSAFEKYSQLISYKKQVIFQGAPGTGKSYLANIFAEPINKIRHKKLVVYTIPLNKEIVDLNISGSVNSFV
jgi:DNA replication protein DnaC